MANLKFKDIRSTGDKALGFACAVLVHGLLLALIIFWPQNQPLKVNLDTPMLNLSQVTIGRKAAQQKPRREAVPASERDAKPRAEQAPATEIPIQALEEELRKAEEIKLAQEKELAEAKKLEEEKKREEERLAEQKKLEEEKRQAEERRLAEQKRLAEEKRKAEARRLAQAREAERRRAAELQAALDNAALEAALEQAELDAERAESGVTGEGGDGVGILGDYIDSVRSRIKPFLTTRPRADGVIFETRARLDIADDGTVTNVTIIDSSGDAVFDSDVLRAVREAGALEPPPSAEYRSLVVPFTSAM